MEWEFDANKRVRDKEESEEANKRNKNFGFGNSIDPDLIRFEEIGGKDFGGEVASFGVDGERSDVDFNNQFSVPGNENKFVEEIVEIIEISSDEEKEDEVEEILNPAITNGVGNQVEQVNLSLGFDDTDFWSNYLGFDSGLNTTTEEEQGNAFDSWLSLATTSSQYPQDIQSASQNHNEFPDANGLRFEEIVIGQLDNRIEQQNIVIDQLDNQIEQQDNRIQQQDNVMVPLDNQIAQQQGIVMVQLDNRIGQQQQQQLQQYADPYADYRMRHLREMAHTYAWVEGSKGASSNQQNPPLVQEELLGKSGGPFSDALKIVIERGKKKKGGLIQWKPSEKRLVLRPSVPSLTDLSSKILVENCEAIVSLELVPDNLRQRLADLICNCRKMNSYMLQLFVEGSPTEIRVKDCSGITEEQLVKAFKKLDTKYLAVLQLDFCGQCRLDSLIHQILAQPFMDLSNLYVISLKGACCLSDDGLKTLARSATAMRSMNLSNCSFLTHDGINSLSESLSSTLKELYIDNCHNINLMLIVPALKNFKHLEVLSVAGNHTVSDKFVIGVIDSCGEKLKELDLSNCPDLTNDSLEVIGKGCPDLHSLNISNLDKLTDLGLQKLADGCRFIRSFKLCRNTFSDEAIAAFLEASGQCMEELSLNYITLVGPCTSFSISQGCTKLVTLDLSWCRKITNEALGLIVDRCLSLKQLKLFGCSQITEVFLNGHSNSMVQIIGLSLTPLLTMDNW